MRIVKVNQYGRIEFLANGHCGAFRPDVHSDRRSVRRLVAYPHGGDVRLTLRRNLQRDERDNINPIRHETEDNQR